MGDSLPTAPASSRSPRTFLTLRPAPKATCREDWRNEDWRNEDWRNVRKWGPKRQRGKVHRLVIIRERPRAGKQFVAMVPSALHP